MEKGHETQTPRSQALRMLSLVVGGPVLLFSLVLFAMFSWSRAGEGGPRAFADMATPALADARAMSRGACWADIDGDDYQDLFVANTRGRSRLWKNGGGRAFVDVSDALHPVEPIEAAAGCAFVDFDNDGYPDLFISAIDRERGLGNRIFRNKGDGTFTEMTSGAGVAMPRRGAAASDWADYDGDGDYDGFVAARTGRRKDRLNALFEWVGPFKFRNTAASKGLDDPPGPQSAFLGSWFDYDVDGDLDLLLAIDFWGVELFRNDGGELTRVTTTALPPATDSTPGAPPNNPMGVTWGDVDNDGCIDVFITGSNFPAQGGFGADVLGDLASRLYRNNCNGTFTDVTTPAGFSPSGVVEWSANFVDFDNDGDLDLSVVAGYSNEVGSRMTPVKRLIAVGVAFPRRVIPAKLAAQLYRMEAMIPAIGSSGPAAAMPNFLYKNLLVETGKAQFVDVTYEMGVGDMGSTQGSAWADFDNDGALDWFVPNRGTPSRLFRNLGPVGNYLRVHLVGDTLRDAIGAWVKIRTANGWQIRYVHVLDGYLSQSQMDVQFGLGTANTVEEIRVRWPGTRQWVRACGAVPANNKVTVTQTGSCRW